MLALLYSCKNEISDLPLDICYEVDEDAANNLRRFADSINRVSIADGRPCVPPRIIPKKDVVVIHLNKPCESFVIHFENDKIALVGIYNPAISNKWVGSAKNIPDAEMKRINERFLNGIINKLK